MKPRLGLSIFLAVMAGCASPPVVKQPLPPPDTNRTMVRLGFCEFGTPNRKACTERSALATARIEAAAVCTAERGGLVEVAFNYYDHTQMYPQWGTGENAYPFVGVSYRYNCTGPSGPQPMSREAPST